MLTLGQKIQSKIKITGAVCVFFATAHSPKENSSTLESNSFPEGKRELVPAQRNEVWQGADMPPTAPSPLATATFSLDTPSKIAQEYIKSRDQNLTAFHYAGAPKAEGRTLTVLKNSGFESAYDTDRKNAAWVAYRIFKIAEGEEKDEDRPSSYRHDMRIVDSPKSNALAGSGYDHGHLAPNFAIGSRYGAKAQIETFLMTNMSPQLPRLNRVVIKAFEMLEAKQYANSHDEIWVITGPIFDNHRTYVSEKIEIPDAFFRILLDEFPNGGSKRDIRVLAFIFPQTATNSKDFTGYLKSIDEIEKATKLDVLSLLPDVVENFLEKQQSASIWDKE